MLHKNYVACFHFSSMGQSLSVATGQRILYILFQQLVTHKNLSNHAKPALKSKNILLSSGYPSANIIVSFIAD